jgi:signal transduction histidine kinase
MSHEEVIGRQINEILFSEQLVPALDYLAADQKAPTEVALTVTRPVKRALLAKIARLETNRLRGWIVLLHDQTRQKRLEYQKAEFISIAAHELRTPLVAVLGYAEFLRDSFTGEELDEERQEYLEAIIRGGQRLNNIVKELLQFAETNQGDVRSDSVTEFKLVDLVEDVMAELGQYAREKNIWLQVDIPDSTLQLYTDRALLRAALYQLILNGINFNNLKGYVRVEGVQKEDQIAIRVVDSGIGIAQRELDTIFRPFFQSEGPDTRRIGGLGLGLSIAQRAISRLSGNLSVESLLNHGSTFTMQLPSRLPTPETEQVSALQAELELTQQQMLAYARDVQTLYRKVQQTNHNLQDINVQLDEANKLKGNFLSVVSHELRSPFASVDMALQTFSRYGTDHLTPEQRELLGQLTENIKDGRRMIDSLVIYASLLSKQGRLDLQEVNITELIERTVETLSPMATRRNLSIEVQATRGLMLPLGDRERIGEAIWHMLHNAVKFNRADGQIIIRARSEGHYLTIEVKDTGPGIPEEKQARIWESFSQLSDSVKRGVEGLGLGLALVRYVALAHGGNVVLHSEPGVGSVFGFWLPLDRNHDS